MFNSKKIFIGAAIIAGIITTTTAIAIPVPPTSVVTFNVNVATNDNTVQWFASDGKDVSVTPNANPISNGNYIFKDISVGINANYTIKFYSNSSSGGECTVNYSNNGVRSVSASDMTCSYDQSNNTVYISQ